MSTFGYVTIGFILIAVFGYSAALVVEVWNTRPVTMFDDRAEEWRAVSLQGQPRYAKRHGERPVKPRYRLEQAPPLEQCWHDPLWPAFRADAPV